MDTVFEFTVSHAGTIGGYVCAQCIAITGADVVTLKDKVIKKMLLPVISMQHQIMSFNPKELHNNGTNFFSFIGNWHTQANQNDQPTHACFPLAKCVYDHADGLLSTMQ